MSRSERAEFYLETDLAGAKRQFVGAGLALLAGAAAAAVVGGLWGPLGGLGAFQVVFLATYLYWMRRTQRRVGLRLDGRGLCELLWLGWPRRIRWEDVTGLDQTDDQAVIHTTCGDLTIDHATRSWRRLAARVASRLGRVAPDEQPGPQVPAEQVEAWLGLAAGGKLVSRTRPWLPSAVLLGAMFVGFGVVALVSGAAPDWWLWSCLPIAGGMLGGLVFAWLMARALGSSIPLRVEATGERLDVYSGRGRETFSWNHIRAVNQALWWREVSTIHGDFVLFAWGSHTERLVAALEQAVAARQEGFSLPERLDVPDGAISRVDEQSVAVDRGLSRPD